MKVLLLNTSNSIGGAAMACRRLQEALVHNGIEATVLTSRGRSGFLRKAIERVLMLPFVGMSWRRSWTVDVNWLGTDITRTRAFRQADVIHLHWVNQGFLSIGDIRRIVRSGKPVVWTMHDLWPLTSIYHYNDEVSDNPGWGLRLLARTTMRRKLHSYGNAGVRFVTCSRWLMRQAENSPLLEGNSITSIPNPIDTSLFCRNSKFESRRRLGLPMDKPVVLFVSQKLTDERKGGRYFVEAMQQLPDCHIVVMGGHGEDILDAIGAEGRALGFLTDQRLIVDVYNAADVFVLPSLNDNLPNTIMEAMACGVPCVGFDIGGIPEMIDHEVNGIIAPPRDSKSLAEGIRYCLVNHDRLSDACVEKVRTTYSQQAVAEKFRQLYTTPT